MKRGRPTKEEQLELSADRFELARAKVFIEVLLQKGWSTDAIAQELRTGFHELTRITPAYVRWWVGRGKPL